jgi:hypothetical protein
LRLGAKAGDKEYAAGVQRTAQVRNEIASGHVRPVQVFDDERHRPLARNMVKQSGDGIEQLAARAPRSVAPLARDQIRIDEQDAQR